MLKTGFEELDKIVQMNQNDLIVVASRPAMGKSTFVSNILSKVNEINSVPVLMISLEESNEKIKNRIFAYRQAKEFTEIYIEDLANVSIIEIKEHAKKYKQEKNIGLIIIDYLQLISFNKPSVLSRDDETIEILKQLKSLSIELNIPIILTSQLSRKLEEREDKRPAISDFQESRKGIAEYIDTVLFIYRDDYYNKNSEHKNVVELIVAKSKNENIGSIKLTYVDTIEGYVQSI